MESVGRSGDNAANARLDFASRLLALTDSLESLYDVDLKTGNYQYFIKPQTAYEQISTLLFEDKDFFTISRKYAKAIVFEEDVDEICTVLTRGFIQNELNKRSHFDWYYRLLINDQPRWYMLRFVYRDELKRNVIIGVINAEKDMQLRRQATIQAMLDHETFQTNLLNYYTENEGDPIKLLKHFATELRDLYQCDQVIYRDHKEVKVSVLSDEMDPNWCVPISYCLQCDQFDAPNAMCHLGTEEDTEQRKSLKGTKAYHKCPILTSLTRPVQLNGMTAGYLSIIYAKEQHLFTDYERKTIEDVCRILSMALSRYNAKKFAERAEIKRKKEEALKALASEHVRLSLDALSYIVDYECTPIQFVEFISDRLLKLSNCDQVIYRDLNGVRYVKNSPKIEEDFEIPEEYCRKCRHSNPLDEVYKYDFTEIPVCASGFAGVPIHSQCPLKSKMTRLVYLDGKVAGYISVHYIRQHHKFSDTEIRTFKEIANIISLSLSRLEARNTNTMLRKEVELKEQVEQSLKIIEGLASTYSAVFFIDLQQDTIVPYAMNSLTQNILSENLKSGMSFTDAFKLFVDKTVFVPDIEDMLKTGTIANLKKQLKGKKTFSHIYRSSYTEKIEYREVTFVKCDAENAKATTVVAGISDKHSDILEQKVIDILSSDYSSMYIADLDNNYCQPIIHSPLYEKIIGGKQRTFNKVNLIFSELVDEKYKEFWENVSDPHWTKQYLADSDRKECLYHISRWNHWYRSEFRVMERNDQGEASKLIITAQIVDQEYADKMAADKKLEEALEQANSASRAKSTFLSNMSHDIRTPMNAIMGYTNLAVTHINDTDLIKDYLTKISESSDHLLSLINDVLDMSRIESGKMTLNEKEENLAEIIHGIRSIVSFNIQNKELDFILEVDELPDEDIIVDRLRLNQVLINTLSNAVKYTPEGGSVTLSICEKQSDRKGFATYQFKVRDTGVGMSASFANTIFDPFTRERNSTISGIQGTGLGMSITKNIVEMMGGTISVESEKGKGTEVTILCTFKLAASQPRPKKRPRQKKSTVHKILMVEDNPLNREIAQELLEESGFTVSTVNDGIYAVETMEKAKKDDFDLILMDLQMPIMDGLEATRRIRALKNGVQDIPIIAITANAFEEDRKAALDAGMNDHVAKPIDLNNLLEAIGRIG